MVIEELKAKAGFGGAKLEIRIPKDCYQSAEVLEGKIILKGGNVDQKIRRLTVSLLRGWSWESYSVGGDLDYEPGIARGPYSTDRISMETRYEFDGDKGVDEISKIELSGVFTIRAEERNEFSFSFELPGIRKEAGVEENWKLRARADLPFGRDPFAEKAIEIIETDNQPGGDD